MPSQTVVTVTVTRATSIPSQQGFGTILLAAYHSLPGALVREVGSIDELETLGFTATAYPAIHRAATVVFSQNPSPTRLKIGRRTTGSLTQVVGISPIAPQGTGFVWSFEADGRAIRYTEQALDAVEDIVAGLVASADWTTPTALDITPTATGGPPVTTVTCTAATADVVHEYKVDLSLFTLTETTADPGIATDLSAFQGYDEDWYGLILDSNSPAEVTAAAGWVATRVKLLGVDAYLSDVPDSGSTTDICSVLATAQRERAYTFWTEGRISNYYAAGIMAYMFATWDPGRATWHLQPLLGVETYGTLLQGRQQTLEGKSCNHLEGFAGQFLTQNGTVATGEFIDVIRYTDYIQARARENVQGTLSRQTRLRGKVPFTDIGISLITGPLQVFLDGEVADDALASASVSAPLAADVSLVNKAERLLPDVAIVAIYAGAIHRVSVRITLAL